jgi:hypothetical protein
MARSRTAVPLPVLPLPPHNEASPYLNQLIRALTFSFQTLNNPGALRGTELALTALPTSGIGLPVGAVYSDDAGFLHIVKANLPLVSGVAAITDTGDVTVVIS